MNTASSPTPYHEAEWFRVHRERQSYPLRLPLAGHQWIRQEARALGMYANQWIDQFLLTEITALAEQEALPEPLTEIQVPCTARSYSITPQTHALLSSAGGAPLARALIQQRINQDPDYPNVDW